jgi:hypothetical protein
MAEQQNPALRIETVSLDHLRAIAESGELYAVADATDAPAVPKKVLELGPQRAVSLYRGSAEEEFWDIAPYLMHVGPPVLDWIMSTLNKERWGIFAVSKANLDALRTHFRHFLKVRAPEGETWHFRFYDPRVLRLFLPPCTSQELTIIFGPLLSFAIARSDRASILVRVESHGSQISRLSSVSPNGSLFFELRPEHVKAFEPMVEAEFATQLMQYIRERHGPTLDGVSDDVLLRRVTFGLSRARSFGLSIEADLAAFVGLMFAISPTFYLQSRMNRILTRNDLDADRRIPVLISETTDQDWDEAASLRRAESWNNLV